MENSKNVELLLQLLREKTIMNTFEISKNLTAITNIPLFLNRQKKKGTILNVSQGYYTLNDIDSTSHYKILEKIYMIDNTGVLTGKSLLYKYEYITKCPKLIDIKTTSSALVNIDCLYRTKRLDSRLKSEPTYVIELYELLKQLKKNRISINYEKVLLQIMREYNLTLKRVEFMFDKVTYEYYQESTKFNEVKGELFRKLESNLEFN